MKKFFLVISILCTLVLSIGFGVKNYQNKELLAYKNDLKQYVGECNSFSDEEKEIIYIAIDHIKTPETIGNSKLISVYQLSQKYSMGIEVDLKSETGRKIKANDWQVDIGDTSEHKNFSAIIDGATLVFIMQIPIA